MKRTLAILALIASVAANAEDRDLGALALESDLAAETARATAAESTNAAEIAGLKLAGVTVWRDTTHNYVITNVTFESGSIFAGLSVTATNLVGVIPVMGTTATVRVTAPYAQGHYTSGMFSAIEIGNLYQLLFAQRAQIGTALYVPSPERIRFTDGLSTTNQYDECSTLQDYLDAASPDRLAEVLQAYLPATGDDVLDGSLSVTGPVSADSLSAGTVNADAAALGSVSVGGTLQVAGDATVSNITATGETTAASVTALKLHIPGAGVHALTNITFGTESPKDMRTYLAELSQQTRANAAFDAAQMAEDRALYVAGMLPDVEGDLDNVWNLKLGRTAIFNDTTSPVTPNTAKLVFFPFYPSGEFTSTNMPLRCAAVVNYTTTVPAFNWGVYSPFQGGWRVVAESADVYSFSAGVPSLLEWRQIGTDTLAVTRRDFAYNVSP